MDAARREKREHGTLSFPFQIYPALDGSEAQDSDYIPYHWHPEFEIITITAGRVSLTIAEQEYAGRRGDVFFVGPEELHEIRAAGRQNQFRSFVFAFDFLQFAGGDQAQSELLAPLAAREKRVETCCLRGQSGQREIRMMLAQIMRACARRPYGYSLAVKAALLAIVAVCAERGRLRTETVRPDYKATRLKEILAFLGAHFAEPLTLTEVADRFGVTPQYFSALFHDSFGKTLTQHINSLRIEQAARLLRETDLPVMEVGFSVGFDNFSYFIKRFRTVYGLAPLQYRARSGEEA